ncbi:MAG TPA: hypothetical protein VHQ95_14780, partial [Pyrinomonadaceae bacterium]|nr:hypothetical protein [Pyrinomonadaceae bacterium]
LALNRPERLVAGAAVEEATQLLAKRTLAIEKLGRYQIVRSLGATLGWRTESLRDSHTGPIADKSW